MNLGRAIPGPGSTTRDTAAGTSAARVHVLWYLARKLPVLAQSLAVLRHPLDDGLHRVGPRLLVDDQHHLSSMREKSGRRILYVSDVVPVAAVRASAASC